MKLVSSAKLLALSFACSLALAQAGHPIRVLYLGGTPEAAGACAAMMQEVGRDAIFIDYRDAADAVSSEDRALYDLVVKASDVKDAAALRAAVQRDVKAEVRAGWQAFVAAREAEKREPNTNVANYEKRAEPLTFQHPYSVKGSMERTQVAADLRLELFASEPDIMKPIAFTWDERGRLWVAETRDYPHSVAPDGVGNDDIKICEDTDGDGKADKFTIFADKLNLPTSLVLVNGGVIVAQPPKLLFLKDTNGDGKADVRTVLVDGFGIKDTHAQASNLHYGMDGWIYGCVGYSGFKATVGGAALDFTMGTFRLKPDGSAMEFLHQFTNNAWAHSTNAAGDQFGGTANGAPIFYGGIPATVFPAGMRGMSAKKINVEEKAHAITPNFRQVDVMGGYTAAAGSSFIYSASLPPRLQGKAMVCEPTMKLISLMDVQSQGAGYVAKDGFNLVASTDEWMSPVFAEVGPDGAVWFADWQNFIIQHNPTPSVERGGYKAETGGGGAHKNDLRDHTRGRIYRVVWDKAPKPKMPALDTTAALVNTLSSDTLHGRLLAQRMLKKDAAPALAALVRANDGSIGAIHALWTLQGLRLLDPALHKAALLAKDPSLRRNAIRALGSDAAAQALFFGSGVVSDPDATTRLAAMVKLVEFPTTPEIKTLAAQLAADPAVRADEWLAEAARVLGKQHKAQAYKEGPNLLPNAGLETIADGLPAGWKRRDYGRPAGNAAAEWAVVSGAGNVHSGQHAVRCITRDNGDTSLFADVTLKPNTEYKMSAWVKTHGFRGKLSLNDHISRHETEKLTKDHDWIEVETTWNSGNQTRASINLLHVAKGDGFYDDVKLCELIPAGDAALAAGDAKRGDEIFHRHPVAACVLCHMQGGQGSTVGPALDGIATRQTAAYISESLLEPNKVLAKAYEALGASPMPPLGLILKPQELADVQAYLQTLK